MMLNMNTYCYEVMWTLFMLLQELMKWAEFCAPYVLLSLFVFFVYTLNACDLLIKKLLRADKKHRHEKAFLRQEKAQLQQQLAIAEAKLAEKHCDCEQNRRDEDGEQNRRHEDGEMEIRDREEAVDVDTVAVLPCEFDADLDFPPLALADDLEDNEETPLVPVDRPEPEPALIPDDDDDEITLGHDSPPRNYTPSSMVATPPSPTPTQENTSPHMDENAPESSSGPEDSPRLGSILTVAYSQKARRMVHVRRSARLLSAGTGTEK